MYHVLHLFEKTTRMFGASVGLCVCVFPQLAQVRTA